jgi:KipI family sensor histidine kinase inhibitor
MNIGVRDLDAPRVSLCGACALLLDAEGPLTLATQERIWRLGEAVRDWAGVADVQPGMNSLLVELDADTVEPETVRERLLAAWMVTRAGRPPGRLLEVAVVYGGASGMDLDDVAAHHGVDVETLVALHAAPDYVVFAPGVTPGFGYLFGLDPRLFTPRRKAPVMRDPDSNVSIGGAQSNLGAPRLGKPPTLGPTGWYSIGRAYDLPVPFDLARDPVSLLVPGDRIRFRVERVER